MGLCRLGKGGTDMRRLQALRKHIRCVHVSRVRNVEIDHLNVLLLTTEPNTIDSYFETQDATVQPSRSKASFRNSLIGPKSAKVFHSAIDTGR